MLAWSHSRAFFRLPDQHIGYILQNGLAFGRALPYILDFFNQVGNIYRGYQGNREKENGRIVVYRHAARRCVDQSIAVDQATNGR